MKLLNNIRNYVHYGAYGNSKEILPLLAGAGGFALAKLLKKKRKKAKGTPNPVQPRNVSKRRPGMEAMGTSMSKRKAGIIRRPGLRKRKPY